MRQVSWIDGLGFPLRTYATSPLVGIVQGEGIGPEVLNAALEVLDAVSGSARPEIEFCENECLGREAKLTTGVSLPDDVVKFCESIFSRGGAILHGPGGARFVYELRTRFDLFFKISPLQQIYAVPGLSPSKDGIGEIDILLTRENSAGVYQGRWGMGTSSSGGRLAWHHFAYSQEQVERFIAVSAQLAGRSRGGLTVVWKEWGLPSISKLWRDCAEDIAKMNGLRLTMVDIDLMVYRLIREPHSFDVIAAPNLFGDVLADLGAALLGSRGVSFSGNYNKAGNAVYQTNHGAAFDLAATDRANPAGQIFALAMMLRETFNLFREASAVEQAVRSVWLDGWRTEDVAIPGARLVGTRAMGALIAERAGEILNSSRRSVRANVGNEVAVRSG